MQARSLALAALLLTLTALAPVEAEADGGLLAGAAKREITPPVGTPMWGYTARHAALASAFDATNGDVPRFVEQHVPPDLELHAKTFIASEGVHTRLYANAFVLDDGRETVAIVHADLGGIPGELHEAVALRLADAGVPIPRARLLVSATHTHGGPGGIFPSPAYAFLGGDAFDPRTFTLVADQVALAVREAWERREPATLAIGEADLAGASRNRAREAHVEGHAHDGDHVKETARVLRLDALDGRPLGAIVNFAAHGTIVDHDDLLFTGDNQGVASRMLARGIASASGRDERDVVVAHVNGAQGDVSPVGDGNGFFERVEDAGRRQATPLLAAWEALAGAGTSRVDVAADLTWVCFCGQEVQDGERISVVPVLGSGEHQTAEPPLQVPGHGAKKPYVVGAPGVLPAVVSVQAMRVGDYVMVTMPGEASVALGEEIERRVAALSPGLTVDLVGLGNDYVSYMSTLPEYDYQDYEGSFNLYGRMTGPLFRDSLVGLAGAVLSGEEPPAPLAEALPFRSPDVPMVSLAPGAPPGAIAQPSATPLGGLARFAWRGGAPSVDHPLDVAMVRVVRVPDGAEVASDLGWEVPVRYHREAPDVHAWSAEWAPREAGEYRFTVDGRALGAGGAVAPYALASAPFTVY